MFVKVPSLIAMEASKLMESVQDLHKSGLTDDYNNKIGYAMTIDSLNVQISDVLEEITDQNKEKLIYEQYAKDPVSCIDVLVSNQRDNLQIISEFCENAKRKPTSYFANSNIYPDIKRYFKQKQIEKAQMLQNQQKEQNDNHNK